MLRQRLRRPSRRMCRAVTLHPRRSAREPPDSYLSMRGRHARVRLDGERSARAKEEGHCGTDRAVPGTASLADPLLSPLHAENHVALPPALIITADLDPARDDGARYARKLSDAGVRVRHVNYAGAPHAFVFMPRICRAAKEAVAEISAEISALCRNEHQ
jgi:acetyl esterase/lipase